MSDVMRSLPQQSDPGGRPGFMRSILRNQSGNVLAITAAATLPMIAVIGGAVDISRVYVTKSRLQAACDAAVLAGRKAMTTVTYTDPAKARANAMFAFNFQDKDYRTTGTSFASSADAKGKVSGTANTTVPMLLMKIFGTRSTAVSVKCSADIQIPNIDIVMVLDVTGSMDKCPDGNNCGYGETKKIDALKIAAKDFYTTLATALAGNTTSQVRYGFVPYDEAVNGLDVFKTSPTANIGELPLTHFVNTMQVESRVANFNTWVDRWIPDPNSNATTFQQYFKLGSTNYNSREPNDAVNSSGASNISNWDCDQYGANLSFQIDDDDKVNLFPLNYSTNVNNNTNWNGEGQGSSALYKPQGSNTWQTAEPTTGDWYIKATFERISNTWSSGFNSCRRRVTQTKYIHQKGYKFTNWTYKSVPLSVSGYKAGTAITYVSSIDSEATVPTSGSYDPVALVPLNVGNTSTTSWNGCIEERTTVAAATFSPIPSGAKDLNFLDGGTTDELRWRPTLAGLTYDRGQEAELTTTDGKSKPSAGCPSARMRSLNVMTQTQFDTYINTLQPGGNTYLDVGMIWGLRLIAAQGIFSSRNLTGPNGGQISRHLIFLTDGEPVSNDTRYTAYGVERVAKRITGSTGVAQAELHARRFQALCDAHRGAVSIWAIGFGTGVTPNLSKCADPGRSYQANSTEDLKTAFKTIANEVADLRLVE